MNHHPYHVRVLLCVLVFAGFGINPNAQERRVDIGIIVAVSEEWSVMARGANRGLAKAGQGIPSGAIVRPLGDRGVISISLRDDRILTCQAKDLAGCQQPIVLSPRTSRAGQFFTILKNIFVPQPTTYAPTGGTRSTDGSELLEVVVKKDHDLVDLRPIFERMRTGVYYLRFVPLKENAEGPKRIRWEWKLDSSPTIAIPELTPGLYKIFVLDETKNFEPRGEESWVLVADATQYGELAARFREAQIWIRSNARGNAEAEHTFLRVYLDYLTQSKKRN